MILVDELKLLYPCPKSSRNCNISLDYCVGGAFCKYLNEDIGFPDEYTLARYIRKVNPKISHSVSLRYALNIIYDNDLGDFSDAWDELGKALSYPC